MPLPPLAPFIAVLTAALAPPPDVVAPSFENDLDHAELVRSDTDAQLIGYNGEGDVIGSIAVWVDDGGQVSVVADFDDGFATTTILDGRPVTEATLAPKLIQRRADAMLGVLEISDDGAPSENRWRCAVAIVGVVLACAKPSIGCPIALYGAACACFPLVEKDFECTGKT